MLENFIKKNVINKVSLNFLVIIILTFVSFYWSFWVLHQDFLLVPVLTVILIRSIASLLIFRDYSASWSKASARAFLIKTLVNGVAFIIYMPIFYGQIRISLLVSELFIYLFGINFLMYSYQYISNFRPKTKKKKLLIFGAGQAGSQLATELDISQYQLKAFIDDDKQLQHRSINGTQILSREAFKNNFNHQHIDLLIIAIPSANTREIREVYQFCYEMVQEVKILPSLNKMLLDEPYGQQLKKVDIKDLLARHPTDLDQDFIHQFIDGKIVLITGGGGTIGGELAKQCLNFGAKQLILLDHSEFNLYQISQTLSSNIVTPILLSVLDKQSLQTVFTQYNIQIVIHAAAYKHVPMVEANIKQGIINNVLGTKNIIDVAIEATVEKMVLISTDKAVRPTNVMGATKRVCELYAQNISSAKTQIVAVRFGNVLGSSGSVIPLFDKQIKAGGPVTVTDPEITRYFMLLDEAAQLVLQATALGKGGEIFILDMGKPIKIASLAEQMIKLSGAQDIDIEFIGLRSGEKLYEELLINQSDKKTSYPSITVASHDNFDINLLNTYIDTLLTSEHKINALKNIVPEFDHRPL